MIKRELVRKDPAGYEIWQETSILPNYVAVSLDDEPETEDISEIIQEIEGASDQTVIMEVAYTPDGNYIGTPEFAAFLCGKRGIAPETITPNGKVYCIGFSGRDQKWYGWSHRAVYGFGIGSKIESSDCAYEPKNKEDFRQNCLRFWQSDNHAKVWAVADERGPEGELGVLTSWEYADTVPNKKLSSKISGVFSAYPDEWGLGEWEAKTLDDAKRMAIAFAESVS